MNISYAILMKKNELLNRFYNEVCDEDTRLDAKHRQLEFLITDKHVQKYLKPRCRIFEVIAEVQVNTLFTMQNKNIQLIY